MCGIAGMAYTGGRPVERGVLEAMTSALSHRGPDDWGLKVDNGGGGRLSVGLGHRRLSILDLSPLGRQPMCNEDGTVWVTFNGEIYNFKEIRSDLESRGHVFNSGTDTEVIVHGFEEFGPDIVKRFNGMFAFAVWDSRNGKLWLCRDRFGKKPLFYAGMREGLIFGSELKSLIAHPDFETRIDPRSLSRFLQYEYVPAPHCIFEGAKKLLPGHILEFDGDSEKIRPYWSVSFNSNYGPTPAGEREASERLEELLGASVRRRLVSDVPLGVFLSGGIDSSTVVAMMSEFVPASEIKTFAIGFTEQSFDESAYARVVADAFGTDHHERILTAGRMVDLVPSIWDLLDEPMADPSIIPTYMLSKFTREHVTVALGGDGGDEIFAGYDPFAAQVFSRRIGRMPRGLNTFLRGVAGLLPASERNMSFDFKIKQFLKGLEYKGIERHQAWLGAYLPDEQARLLHKDVIAGLSGFDPFGDVRDSVAGKFFRDEVDALVYFYLRFYMAGHILVKVDMASMAHALEVRAPFLDPDLVEFVNHLPSRFKLNGLKRKYLLKKMVKDKLPPEIFGRGKKGFGIPLAKWLKEDLRPLMLDTFSESRLKAGGLFDPAEVMRLLNEHLSGKKDNRKQLWTLLCFEMWRERFTRSMKMAA